MLDAIRSGRHQALLDAIPYVHHLGIRVLDGPADSPLRFFLPFRAELVGNSALPALHGGVVGALLETAALIQVIVSERQSRLPKLVDFSVDYLRSARTRDCHAVCEVVRRGNRIVAVAVRCWQEDDARPIATARAHLLLVARGASPVEGGDDAAPAMPEVG
jgi:uncharacterized protein (TIGR00369 family)